VVDPPAGVAALGRWAGISTLTARDEIASRPDVLTRLALDRLRSA
jgi:hypothetical protein